MKTAYASHRAFWLLVFLAILIRGPVLYFANQSLAQDPDAYQAIASTLHFQKVFGLTTTDGETIPTAFRPPLYPFLLSYFVTSNGSPDIRLIGLLHLIASVLTGIFIQGATKAILKGHTNLRRAEQVSLLAATLVILDPILVQQSTFAMTETIAALLTSMVFWLSTKRQSDDWSWKTSCGLGIAFSLAYLCRPTFLAWAVIFMAGEFIATLVRRRKQSTQFRRRRLLKRCAILLMILSTVGLWMDRNRRQLGHPSWATTHGGYTLLLGNNPLFYRHLESGGMLTRWDAQAFTTAYAYRFGEDGRNEGFWLRARDQSQPPVPPSPDLTEHSDDQWSYHAAMATIYRSPGTFFRSCVNRLYRLWTPFPFPSSDRSGLKRLVIAIFYLMLYLASCIGFFRLIKQRNLKALWCIASLFLTLSFIHMFYWSNLRMRAPAIPLLAVAAAAAFASIGSGIKQEQDVAHT